MMLTAFSPELTVLISAITFVILACLRQSDARRDHLTAMGLSALTLFVSLLSLSLRGDLFQE
ncbi:MAG: hypothetical protein P8Z73_10820, partial [Desulfobacteraceae bacterium]